MLPQDATPKIRSAAQQIRDTLQEIYQADSNAIAPADLNWIYQQVEIILAALPSDRNERHHGNGCLYAGWPDYLAIRLFIAQQLETEAAFQRSLPYPSRGDDPTITDAQLDAAWPELETTLRFAMAYWEYPDQVLDLLEDQGRCCADYVLNQAPAPQRQALADAAAHALTNLPATSEPDAR